MAQINQTVVFPFNVRLAADPTNGQSKTTGKPYVKLSGYKKLAPVVNTETGEQVYPEQTVNVYVFGWGRQQAQAFKTGDFVHVTPFGMEQREGTYNGHPLRPVYLTSDVVLKSRPQPVQPVDYVDAETGEIETH